MDFYVPNYSSLINGLDNQIAAGPPKLDFSFISNALQNYDKGVQTKQDIAQRNLFQNGVPRLVNGDIDLGNVIQNAAKVQGAAALPAISQLAKLQYGQRANQNAFPGQDGQPPAAMPPPSSAPAIPNTMKVAPSADQLGPKISAIESGGNYQAVGPAVYRKDGSVDRALGKYQIMMSNVGPWTKEILGQEMSPREFLQNPQAQEAVYKAKMGQYLDQTGNAADAASMWFTGHPLAQGANRQDVNGVTGAQYAQAVAGGPSSPTMADPSFGGLVPKAFVQKYGAAAPGQYINLLSRYVSSGMLAPEQAKNYQSRIDAIEKAMSAASEPTQAGKDYATAVRQGYTGTQQQFEADQKLQQSRAGKQGEQFAAKYGNLQEAGVKAAGSVPQLEIAKRLTLENNFYSGFAANKVLAAKLILGALGGNPNSAAPMQEAQGLVNSSILSGLKSIVQGTGQVRSAELHLMQSAAAAPFDSPAAYRFKLNVAIRAQQRAADLADLAQKYKGGNLDSGFDKAATEFMRAHPMFSPAEIKNPKLLGLPEFDSPAEVSAAKLPRGTQFRVGNTDQVRMVP